MSEITFLTEKQIFGKDRLEIFDKIGVKAAMTDFSILLGNDVSNIYYTNEGNELKHRTGSYWTKTYAGYNCVHLVSRNGRSDYAVVYSRYVGARPALPYSLICDISSNKVRGANGVLEVEYGEYPQWVPSCECQLLLDTAYRNGSITNLTDLGRYNEYNIRVQGTIPKIYEYRGKRYIRLNAFNFRDRLTLSNGHDYFGVKSVWIEISPIKWVVDERKNIALSKNIVFAGVLFENGKSYEGNFNSSNIKRFINNSFSRDIMLLNGFGNVSNEKLHEKLRLLREELNSANEEISLLRKENEGYKAKIRKIDDFVKKY